jgi:hypothetical protein
MLGPYELFLGYPVLHCHQDFPIQVSKVFAKIPRYPLWVWAVYKGDVSLTKMGKSLEWF